jgi:4-amino-4-deoxy-L-arabinose transferase-like glycosyltransferase
MKPERRLLLALFAIAFGIRILYVALGGMDSSINPDPITSEAMYGFKIASGTEWITEPYSPRAPGYPFFLGVLFLIFGKSIWPAIFVQALLGGFLSILLYKLGKILGGWGVGLFSALWIALFMHHIFFSSLLVRDALSCFILTALVFTLAKPFSRMRNALIAGALFAFLIHIDPQFILLLPLFAAIMLLFISRYLVLNLQYMILFVSFAIIVSLPWTARNYYVYKQLMPVGIEASRFITPVKDKIPPKVQAMLRGKVPAVSNSRFDRIAMNSTEFWRVTRMGTAADADSASRPISRSGPWSLRHNIISIASYGALLPFFILGIVTVFARKNRAGMIIAATALYYYLIRLFFGGSEKARLQIEPLIILLAFFAIFEIVQMVRKPSAQSKLESGS